MMTPYAAIQHRFQRTARGRGQSVRLAVPDRRYRRDSALRIGLLLGFALGLQAQTITWTTRTTDGSWPKYTGYSTLRRDPVSGQVIFPSHTTTAGSIFASTLYACDPLHADLHCVFMNGPAEAVSGCMTADSDTWGNAHLY